MISFCSHKVVKPDEQGMDEGWSWQVDDWTMWQTNSKGHSD